MARHRFFSPFQTLCFSASYRRSFLDDDLALFEKFIGILSGLSVISSSMTDNRTKSRLSTSSTWAVTRCSPHGFRFFVFRLVGGQ